jgi:hypothetical protein
MLPKEMQKWVEVSLQLPFVSGRQVSFQNQLQTCADSHIADIGIPFGQIWHIMVLASAGGIDTATICHGINSLNHYIVCLRMRRKNNCLFYSIDSWFFYIITLSFVLSYGIGRATAIKVLQFTRVSLSIAKAYLYG